MERRLFDESSLDIACKSGMFRTHIRLQDKDVGRQLTYNLNAYSVSD